MVDKFVCMTNGCDFVSESRSEAIEHMQSSPEHEVAEIMVRGEGEVACHVLGEIEYDKEEE